jgi:hypothetical protein
VSYGWLVCALTAGPTREDPPRYFGSRFLARAAELLPGVPVGFCRRPNGELDHPHRDELEGCTVGHVLNAWCTTGQSVLATVAISSLWMRRALEAHERDQRLRALGVSLFFDPDGLVFRPRSDGVVDFADAQRIWSLDFVTRPASPGAHILRSVS